METQAFVWQNHKSGQFRRIARLIEVNYSGATPEMFAKISSDYGRVQKELGTEGELDFAESEKEGLSKGKNTVVGLVKGGYIRKLVIWEKGARQLFKKTVGDLVSDWQAQMGIPLPAAFKAEFGIQD